MPKQSKRIDFECSFGSVDGCETKATTHCDTAHFHSLFNIKLSEKIYTDILYNDVINGDTGPAISFCVFLWNGFCLFGKMYLVRCWFFIIFSITRWLFHWCCCSSSSSSEIAIFIFISPHELSVNVQRHRASLYPLSECDAPLFEMPLWSLCISIKL